MPFLGRGPALRDFIEYTQYMYFFDATQDFMCFKKTHQIISNNRKNNQKKQNYI